MEDLYSDNIEMIIPSMENGSPWLSNVYEFVSHGVQLRRDWTEMVRYGKELLPL